MRVTGLDGREYVFNPDGRVYGDDIRRRSSYHLMARQLILAVYPLDILHEEVQLPGTRNIAHGTLTADFVVLRRRLLIEVHGEQHYSFSAHFHGNENGFKRSQVRDKNKKKWCEINNFRYIELSYKETEDEWRTRIRGCSTEGTD